MHGCYVQLPPFFTCAIPSPTLICPQRLPLPPRLAPLGKALIMTNDTGKMAPLPCPPKSFVLGYNDFLSGAGFRRTYETMPPAEQQNYEYGRICAQEILTAKRPAPKLSPFCKLPAGLPFFNLPPAQAPNPALAFAPNLDRRGFPRPIRSF